MRISDWSSDVCSSDLWSQERPTTARISSYWKTHSLRPRRALVLVSRCHKGNNLSPACKLRFGPASSPWQCFEGLVAYLSTKGFMRAPSASQAHWCPAGRSEEHTSELQSLMRISYAVFCLKKKNTITTRKNI